MPTTTQNLNMTMGTDTSSAPLFHEILTKVNNAKDKPAKIAVLKKHDSVPLRQVLKVPLILKSSGTYLKACRHLKEMTHQQAQSIHHYFQKIQKTMAFRKRR